MEIHEEIRNALKEVADEKVRESGKRFFKDNPPESYGVKASETRKIEKHFWKEIQSKSMDKAEIFSLCDTLWKTEIQEEIFIACGFLERLSNQFEEKDIFQFEQWINQHVHNWASCDTFCNHTVAEYMMKFPEKSSLLKGWATSENLWLRRASVVTLIIPARKGLFRELIFELCDTLLMDKEDLVQKGYGWVLKAAADFDNEDVFQYILQHKDTMPRTSLRYSIEKMPKEMKDKAMGRS